MESQPIRHKFTDFDDDDDFPDEYTYLGEEQVQLEKGFAKMIIVDNLPVIPEIKYQKLLSVVGKIYNPLSVVEIDMPQDDKGSTKGFAFIEFATAAGAADAVAKTNGYRLDNSHILRVSFYEDFFIYDTLSETYQPDEVPPFKPKGNLWWWLVEPDGRARDQFVLRHADWTEIFWNDAKKKIEPIYQRKLMTEKYVEWSPYGTYLTTFHKEGIILWGGENWDKVARFRHQDAQAISFSPKETYIVTTSGDPKKGDMYNIIVWDVQLGRQMRSFQLPKEKSVPLIKWSFDEKYFAYLAKDAIAVFETPSMGMLGKTSIKVPSVKTFEWSPTDNIIACCIPERDSKPATAHLIDIPSKVIRRSHNIFKVQDCSLEWSPTGDYLCIRVDKTTTKKTKCTAFEICRIREKGIPIESITIPDQVVTFAWEPKGHRFVVVHGTSASRPDISFYSVEGKKHQFLMKLEKRTVNKIFWSPRGSFVVLAGIGSVMGGFLEFFNVDDLESMRTDSHHMLTDVAWDPTGRYVTTWTSQWKSQLDHGYSMWTFQGKMLLHVTKDKFFSFQWRPRPPSILTPEQAKKVEKNLREYAQKYRKQDMERKKAAIEVWKKKRDEERNVFYKLKNERLDERQKEKPSRVKICGYDSEDEKFFEEREEEVEDVISDTKEIIVPDPEDL